MGRPGPAMSLFMSRTGGSKKDEAKYRKEIRRIFTRADKDGDGKLSKEEWFRVLNTAGCETSMEEVAEFFERMDRDYDGKLSFAEFMGEETPLEKLFRTMDRDGNGSITKHEFLAVCKNLPEKQVEEAFEKYDIGGQRLDYKGFCLMIHGEKK